MAQLQANLTRDEKQIETLEQLLCVAGWTVAIHKQLIFISAVNIFLSIIAVFGNSLILVALNRESSLHPPSKLLFRCLATTDLCLGLIAEPLHIVFWMSLVHEDWELCRFALTFGFIAAYTLVIVSLFTVTAISVDRLLALLLGLRYRQVVTLKRTYVIVIIFWILSTAVGTSYLKSYRIAFWYAYTGMPLCLVAAILSYMYMKIFVAFRRHNHNQM